MRDDETIRSLEARLRESKDACSPSITQVLDKVFRDSKTLYVNLTDGELRAVRKIILLLHREYMSNVQELGNMISTLTTVVSQIEYCSVLGPALQEVFDDCSDNDDCPIVMMLKKMYKEMEDVDTEKERS